jgi:hypothetical protein
MLLRHCDGSRPDRRAKQWHAYIEKFASFWARPLCKKTAREIASGERIYGMKTSIGDLEEPAAVEIAKALRARIDRLCVRTQDSDFSLMGWLEVAH